ncbi:heparinase II/III family protein [Gemmatimonas aurantiaca]|uniref:heparinase II/III domain-containing protein n=1 Tax=Gemmatimonas aurantiaca TaxID=173480 RepID=UPI00301C08C7
MTRLLAFDVQTRRRAVAPGGVFAALADGLAAELVPLQQAAALPIPDGKARLTRIGGRCPVHGVLLEFDPWQPRSHRCRFCARDYQRPEHDDWWAMNAQLWTVERAVHAAALFLLRGDLAHAELAESILRELADRYDTWPNRDNVLGPSRPFFSTYLESIWLLNACHALSLLETAGRQVVSDVVRDRLLTPSSALIAGFPEGRSNRQVWNDIAILSAWTLLGREREVDARLTAPQSLPWLLEHGLLADGSWYEGENYHLFAHRGLWYGVQWLRATGRMLPAVLDERFHRGFLTPFVGVLPDETLPARRDAQYAVSIRQWRIAEYCELGQAYRADPVLAALLSRLYAPGVDASVFPRAGRRLSTADAERHDAPGPLSRADLSWRALLMADAHTKTTPATASGASRQTVDGSAGTSTEASGTLLTLPSACLPSQGLAVIRRDGGQVYVALEGGETGGGHGHPDRLALTLQTNTERWLDDPGTGSYVERTLHWYRSTLAHHAPLVNGRSQQRKPATLLAFEDRGGAGWIRKRVHDIAPGVIVTRTVVVCDGHLVDVLEWEAPESVVITLPVAGAATVPSVAAWEPTIREGAGGLEDGFDFLRRVEQARLAIAVDADERSGVDAGAGATTSSAGVPVELVPRTTGGDGPDSERGAEQIADATQVWYAASAPMRLLRADAPSPPLGAGSAGAAATGTSVNDPGQDPSLRMVPRHWLEVTGTRGCIVGVWSWALHERHGSPSAVHRVSFPRLSPAGSPLASHAPSDAVVRIETVDGTISEHRPTDTGWQIALTARHARSSIDLDALASAAAPAVDTVAPAPAPDGDSDTGTPSSLAERPSITVPRSGRAAVPSLREPLTGATVVTLAASNYRPTEWPWSATHAPSARVALLCTDDVLVARLSMRLGMTGEAPPASPRWGTGSTAAMPDNPLDNERADVNVSGVQWYVTGDGRTWNAAGLVALLGGEPHGTPEPAGVRLTALVNTDNRPEPVGQPTCQWQSHPDGWDLQLVWSLAALPVTEANGHGHRVVGFQLVINEAIDGRERRLGQLVLGGGGGFAYLRGDREDPRSALTLHLP